MTNIRARVTKRKIKNVKSRRDVKRRRALDMRNWGLGKGGYQRDTNSSLSESTVHESANAVLKVFLEKLFSFYLIPLREHLDNNPSLFKSTPGFLVCPEELVVYMGRTHIGVEYIGPELLDNDELSDGFDARFFDYSREDMSLLKEIVGFETDSNTKSGVVLPEYVENIVLPTNKGAEKLSELKWNFFAQDSIFMLNADFPTLKEGQFHRIVNGLFFDSDDFGLKTRHIKWLDFFPVSISPLALKLKRCRLI